MAVVLVVVLTTVMVVTMVVVAFMVVVVMKFSVVICENSSLFGSYPLTGCAILRYAVLCKTSMSPHLVHSQFVDGGEVVSLTHPSHFTPQENAWYLFLLEARS
jgi:hypothetical protein